MVVKKWSLVLACLAAACCAKRSQADENQPLPTGTTPVMISDENEEPELMETPLDQFPALQNPIQPTSNEGYIGAQTLGGAEYDTAGGLIATDAAGAGSAAAGCGCTDGACGCGDGSCGCATGACGCPAGHGCLPPGLCFSTGEPFHLVPEFFGIQVGGWGNGGYTHNETGSLDGYNGPVSFNDRDDRFQMNQIYLYAERSVDSSVTFDIGGRFDLLLGTDHRFTMARGLETRSDRSPHWNTNTQEFGLALPQAYLEVGNSQASVKLGHFYTIIGYETVMAPDNFFYSHAYTMQYGEPFTHTGLLASVQLVPGITALGGFGRGWDNWEDDPEDELNFFGGLTANLSSGTQVSSTFTIGKEPGVDIAPNGNQVLFSNVIQQELMPFLTCVVQSDYGKNNRGSLSPSGQVQDAEWYGVNTYFYMQLTECLSIGNRCEWFRDDDGVRVVAVDPQNTFNGGYAGNFWANTLGLNYKPIPNCTLRQELRYDWFSGNAQPFNSGTEAKQFTLGTDVILTY